MSMKDTIESLTRAFELIPHSILGLFARFIIGLVFFQSWLTKVDFETWSILPKTFFLFENIYKVPIIPSAAATYMATISELVFPVMLWLGLGTRIAAMALLGMTLVIQTFVYPEAYVTHGLWAIALLLLMRYGPGKLSLDWLIWGRNKDES
jgi:putative oxidoreductase